ncbi:carbon-nitrogen hydrolase family protein [Candidatus Latescibacterota bacterium]
MDTDNKISRRKLLKSSALGVSSIGAGIITPATISSSEKSTRNMISSTGKNSPREARILSVTIDGIEDKNKAVDKILESLEIMRSNKPDIICLPETFGTFVETAEKLSGTIINEFASIAKKYNSYIICPVHTINKNKIYNSAVLIDRDGNIQGQYDKIHPTEGECDSGTTPGSSPPPVFKTDFGTIGILICYDINWMQEWRSLKEQGAEIVFWPSAYPGSRMLSSYAWIYKYYIVGCPRYNPANIFDMTGDLIDKSGIYTPWAFATLNMEKIFCEIDYHVRKANDIIKKYGERVLVKFYHEEDWVTVESCSPDLTIKEIIDEFELTSHWDYIKRAEKYQNTFR